MEPMKRNVYFGLGFVLSIGLLIPASAQDNAQSGDSLGNYARQVRKDGGTAKAKPKTFDNDNLPREDKLSVVGNAAPTPPAPVTGDKDAAAANATAPATGDKAPASDSKNATPPSANSPGQDPKERAEATKQWADKITAQKDAIDLSQRELDVLQREYQLRA